MYVFIKSNGMYVCFLLLLTAYLASEIVIKQHLQGLLKIVEMKGEKLRTFTAYVNFVKHLYRDGR